MRSLTIACLSALIAVVAACTSIDCSINSTVALQCQFREASTGQNVALTTPITVVSQRHDGSDTVLINLMANASCISLPLSYAGEEDVFTIYVNDAEGNIIGTDTLRVRKTNEPVFESVDCAPHYNHTLLEATCGNNFIKEVEINKTQVTNDLSKVHIYLNLYSGE